jgi:hypothetical protein
MERKVYISLITGWVAGRRVEVGDRLELTEDQARYEPVDPEEVVVAAIQRKERAAK